MQQDVLTDARTRSVRHDIKCNTKYQCHQTKKQKTFLYCTFFAWTFAFQTFTKLSEEPKRTLINFCTSYLKHIRSITGEYSNMVFGFLHIAKVNTWSKLENLIQSGSRTQLSSLQTKNSCSPLRCRHYNSQVSTFTTSPLLHFYFGQTVQLL